MQTLLFRLLGVAVIACANTGAHAQGWNPAKTMLVDQLVTAQLLPQSPSIGLGIDVNGVTALRRNENTVYHIGSVTKQFTAAAVMSLIEEGKLVPYAPDGVARRPITLATPLTDFFVNIGSWSQPGYAELTVQHLLTMTSNLPSYTNVSPPGVMPGTLIPQQSVAWDRLLEGVKGYGRVGLPGAFEYSNTNYFLLAQIVHIMTGPNFSGAGDYRDYLRSRIFSRTGMSSTGFIAEPPGGLSFAPPTGGGLASFHLPDWPKGAGDIRSNANDMQAWLRALLANQVLSASSTQSLFAPAAAVLPPNPRAGWSYAMGWFCRAEGPYDECIHDGAIAGYSSIVGWRRHRASGNHASVTLLANRDGVASLEPVARQILTLAFQ